ncbi:hypothetical protein ACTWP5_27680 [Streptomyces sp. 4N509B]|uniref:hypothetical protein n=1 Tax=Streptomyces sp. 4N509B TaxID=3457413 RepID=UPI003FD35552
MAKSLSPREVKQRKRDAEAFARKAKPGHTYYYVAEYNRRFGGDTLPTRLLSEVVFQKPVRLYGPYPHWYATLTAYECYLKNGPLYEDRDHRAIRGMQTLHEYTEEAEKRSAAIFANRY